MNKENTAPDARCAACPMAKVYDRRCSREDGKNPRGCPTALMPKMAREALEVYKTGEFALMAKTAALVERAGYERTPGGLKPTRPRITELVDFARRMGYTKLSLLFCLGLRKEADIARKILETNGFEVISVICKVGCLPKSELGLIREDQLNPDGPESMCNPVMQAEIANEAGVDLNILLGLCVGHDSLVLAHVKAPATILAVKDRLMGHNSLAALYQYDAYYGFLHNPLFPDA